MDKKERVNNEADPMEVVQSSSKLDAIKEIIFGQNMREYDESFDEIRAHINTNLDAVSVEISKVKTMLEDMETRLSAKMESSDKRVTDQLSKIIDKSEQEILKKIEKLDDSKTDRKRLGKWLIDLGNKLSA